jgi:hypothetical protein
MPCAKELLYHNLAVEDTRDRHDRLAQEVDRDQAGNCADQDTGSVLGRSGDRMVRWKAVSPNHCLKVLSGDGRLSRDRLPRPVGEDTVILVLSEVDNHHSARGTT